MAGFTAWRSRDQTEPTPVDAGREGQRDAGSIPATSTSLRQGFGWQGQRKSWRRLPAIVPPCGTSEGLAHHRKIARQSLERRRALYSYDPAACDRGGNRAASRFAARNPRVSSPPSFPARGPPRPSSEPRSAATPPVPPWLPRAALQNASRHRGLHPCANIALLPARSLFHVRPPFPSPLLSLPAAIDLRKQPRTVAQPADPRHRQSRPERRSRG